MEQLSSVSPIPDKKTHTCVCVRGVYLCIPCTQINEIYMRVYVYIVCLCLHAEDLKAAFNASKIS